jgi:tetrahydromethanopterin S-methyltransferase subunit F
MGTHFWFRDRTLLSGLNSEVVEGIFYGFFFNTGSHRGKVLIVLGF